jgi:TPR repeat protein
MTKTRRGSRNKRKTTRRMRQHKKGGAPKVAPSEQTKEEVKIMAQPPHDSLVPAADIQLSFTPAARDSLIVQGARADYMLRHLGIPRATHHHDPLSATQAPLESARARVMVNTMIDAIYASVDRLRARGDFANAVVQLDRAVALGSMRARVELADIMCSGRVGVHQNVDMACALLNDTAARRNPDCMGLRAFLQMRGICPMDDIADILVETDLDGLDETHVYTIQYANAEYDAIKSARSGSKYGQFALGSFEEEDENPNSDSIPNFERAAAQNYFRAQTALGCKWYHRPAPTEASFAEARRLFTLAAEQGYPLAMHNLGVMCLFKVREDEEGDREEMALAAHWFNLAASVPFGPSIDAVEAVKERALGKAGRMWFETRVVCNEP